MICDRFGGRQAIRSGTLNLFVDEGDLTSKKVIYRLVFEDAQGEPLTLSGTKELHDDPGKDAKSDTREVHARIYRGMVAADEEEGAELLASGILRAGPAAFLRQLTTFRTEGPTLADRTSALARFGAFYFGRLWDVYARRVLPSAPF